MLEAKQLYLKTTAVPRVSGVNLQCSPGSVTAILGPNGAGKTSLLKLLSAELEPQQGELLLLNKPIKNIPRRQLATIMAVLPQHSSLNFPFTVEEVVLLGRTPHNSGIRHDKVLVRKALKQLDIDYVAKRFYPELSGGEKQRVQIARVLVQIWEPVFINDIKQPRLLLLDEPAASLDIAHQQLLQQLVAELAQQQITIIMVVHDLNMAFATADQIVLMNCGQIAAKGLPEELANQSLLKKVFNVTVNIIQHPHSGRPIITV